LAKLGKSNRWTCAYGLVHPRLSTQVNVLDR
jgi:hypothetical protein